MVDEVAEGGGRGGRVVAGREFEREGGVGGGLVGEGRGVAGEGCWGEGEEGGEEEVGGLHFGWLGGWIEWVGWRA